MAQPYDYTLHVDSPFKAAVQGYQAGAMIRDDQAQQQQLQVAQQQKLQQQQDFYRVANNPNASPSDFAALTLKYPAFKDQFKQANDMLSTEQKQNTLKSGTEVYAALSSNAPDVAKKLLNQRAAALRNSGDEQGAKHAEAMSGVIDINPTLARNMLGLSLTAADDKFASNVATLNTDARAQTEAPADLAIKNATAGIKSVEAKNAPTKTALDNANTQSVIDDRAASQRIAELDTQIKQATSETQRGQLVLERDKFIADQKLKAGGVADDAQSKLDTYNQSIATVDAVMKHPGLTSSWGLGGVGTVTGKLSGLIPGSDRKDFEGLVDTLKSQEFLAGVKQMTGMGALSNAEGEKINTAVASLNLDQSPQGFKNALGVIKANLQKAQNKVIGSGKLPTSGGGFTQNVPGIGVVREGDINRLLTQNPGSTREQVIKYLDSLSGAGQIPGR